MPVSEKLRAIDRTLHGFVGFYGTLPEERKADFLFGNPHEPAGRAYVEALRTAAEPVDRHRYEYTMTLAGAAAAIAANLTERFGASFEPEDVSITNGNFAGLSSVLRAVGDPGCEVVYVSPPWFFYEALIVGADMTPVRVPAVADTYDLDVDAIADAITPSTRAVIVNSPHNPSGRIVSPSQLDDLAAALTAASERNARPVYLISDEAYNRIVFDGRSFPTPTTRYPFSFLLYTYAKTLLSPGSRLGYVAMPSSMPEREEMRDALELAQIATGWAFASSILQHAVPDLERLDPGVDRLQRRRDLVCDALREQGYELLVPEGTFYVLARSPIDDDRAFARLLAADDVWVLPGSMFESPGRFRISLTANDEMVEYAIPRFGAAIARAGA
ncbi:MAG TPA: aminotransferase class I/II-fold pyridoxal phosphate-dependent enzyme [Actinomycetota bacterium]|nr:aminotransferase class I/II-fold pyridoxal phosphate-dependent enzyme [Actinomycetota bacterium]